MAIFCDQKGVFPLGARLSVHGAGGPAVLGIDVAGSGAGVDHRLDGEGHAGSKRDVHLVVMVGNLRGFMEVDTGAVAFQFSSSESELS